MTAAPHRSRTRARLAALAAISAIAVVAGAWLAFAAVEGVPSLNRERYNAAQTATLSVADADLNLDSTTANSAVVNFNSTTDAAGITVILTETGVNTGIFMGPATFSQTASNDILDVLRVSAGDTVTLTYVDSAPAGTRTTTATMFANTATAALDAAAYPLDGAPVLTVNDVDGNLNSAAIETLSATLSSSSDAIGISVVLTETGAATGIFTGDATLTTDASDDADDELQVGPGDSITLTYAEPLFNGVATTNRTDTANIQTPGNAFFGSTLLGDETRYRLGDTATLTVEDGDLDLNPAALDTATAGVTSTSDGTGIAVTLTESGPATGVFQGSSTFTTGASNDASDTLQVAQGDTVTLSYSDASPAATITDTATMYADTAPATLDREHYRRTDTATLSVTDADRNTNPSTAQTFSVTLSSSADGASPISVTLTESGPNTGVFTGSATFVTGTSNDVNDQLQVAAGSVVTLAYSEPLFAGGNASRTDTAVMFVDLGSVALDANVYALDDTATITVDDEDRNLDASTPDTVAATLASSADATGISVVLTETGNATGLFAGTATFSNTGSNDTSDVLRIAPGGTITASYLEPNFAGTATLTRTDSATVPVNGTIGLDAEMYGIDDTATFTVVDPDLNTNAGSLQSVGIAFESDSDTDGISVTLTETSNDSGTFTGTATFSDTASNDAGDVLEVSPSDVITATYAETSTFDGPNADRTATASMFAGNSTVGLNAETYALDDTVTITVSDPEENAAPGAPDTVDVTLSSGSNEAGITVELTETGNDTGVFTGTATFSDTASNDDADIIDVVQGDAVVVEYVEHLFGEETEQHSDVAVMFVNGSLALDAARYALTDAVTITVTDPDMNADPDVADTVDVGLASGADPIGITVTLTEAAANSGVFQGSATFSDAASDDGNDILLVDPGDLVTGSYEETNTFDGPNAARTDTAAIDPKVTAATPDELARAVVGRDVTITGEGFADGAEVSIAGDGVTVNSTDFVSATELTVNVAIARDADLGDHAITVDNPNGGTATCNACWAVIEEIAAYDFDGNGGADLAVGAPGDTVGGYARAGAVNVIYSGSPLSADGDQLWSQASAGIASAARAGEAFGSALASGDFNADGYADLAIGAPGQRVAGNTAAGAVHVLYGSADGLVGAGGAYLHQDVDGIGETAGARDVFGAALAVADIDGDLFADLIVGAPGENVGTIDNAGTAHVIFGTSSGLASAGSQLWHQNSTGVAGGAEPQDAFGGALATGDFDDDGFADVAAGAPGEGVAGRSGAGGVNVLYGGATGLTATGDQFWSQASTGILGGPRSDDAFGASLAAGDLDGDDIADLAVGVPHDTVSSRVGAGAVSVILGSSSGLVNAGDVLVHQDVAGVLSVAQRNEAFGFSLATGDVDGDGTADLAVGVPGQGVDGDLGAGAVQLLYGGPGFTGSIDQLIHQDGMGLTSAPGEGLGFAVRLGDFDGDGDGDLAAGAPFEKVGGASSAGTVIVVYSDGTNLTASGRQRWRQGGGGILGTAQSGDFVGAAL